MHKWFGHANIGSIVEGLKNQTKRGRSEKYKLLNEKCESCMYSKHYLLSLFNVTRDKHRHIVAFRVPLLANNNREDNRLVHVANVVGMIEDIDHSQTVKKLQYQTVIKCLQMKTLMEFRFPRHASF